MESALNEYRARGGNWKATDGPTDHGRLFNSESPLPADLEIAYLNSPLQFALHSHAWGGLGEGVLDDRLGGISSKQPSKVEQNLVTSLWLNDIGLRVSSNDRETDGAISISIRSMHRRFLSPVSQRSETEDGRLNRRVDPSVEIVFVAEMGRGS